MILASYVVWYTLVRIPIESIRLDHAQEFTILGITARTNTWTSVIMFLIAVALLVYSIINRPQTPEEHARAELVFREGYQDDQIGRASCRASGEAEVAHASVE